MPARRTVGVARADIPARLVGGDAVSVDSDGLNLVIGLAVEDLEEADPGSDLEAQWMPIWDETIDAYRRRAVSDIVSIEGSVAWDDVTDKPSTFPPDDHTHPWDDLTGAASLAAPVSINYSSSEVGILYGYTAGIKGTGTSTSLVVGAQINAFSKNTSGARSVFGIACEAWSGDAATVPTVTAVLIGIEPAVISQYHANTSALLAIDAVFKNRADGQTAAPGGLGSNSYNQNSRALQISSQSRGTDGEYCGWKTGILFNADSIDRTVTAVDACCIDMSLVDNTRLASTIRMPTSGFISWDGDARKLGVTSGSIYWQVSGINYFVCDSSGNFSVTGQYRVDGIKVIGNRETGWTGMTGTGNKSDVYDHSTVTLVQLAARVKSIQDALEIHGLIGT